MRYQYQKQKEEGSGFGYVILGLLIVMLVMYMLTASPVPAQRLDVTGVSQPANSSGPVFRYQIAAASTTAYVTPALDVGGFAYATVQVLGNVGLATGTANAVILITGSAIANSGYLAPLPNAIGGATTTATIEHYGIYTFDLGAINSLGASISANSATQELIISLSKVRN